MLVAIPQITNEFAHINALFLQPTPWCSRNCNGCYVKGFEKLQSITTSNFYVFKDILNVINREPEADYIERGPSFLRANQITFALDKLSSSTDNSLIMIDLYKDFINAKKRSIGGEFHITVHTVGDLDDYSFSLLYDPVLFDMISISHINVSDLKAFNLIRRDVSNKINWNLTIDPDVNIQKIKDSFQVIAKEVDSIYLVLHKPNTGSFFNPQAFLIHQDFLKFIRTMPKDIQNKVHVDGCLVDSKKFLSTGYGCSSNVSRFQVWPNGSVTGCAYNQNKITGPSTDIYMFLKNLYKASKVYEFDECKIPYHLDPNNKNIKCRTNKYLEIIT